MPEFDPSAYGPLFLPLLATDRCRSLDASLPGGEPADRESQEALDLLTIETAFAHTTIENRDMAACCISGVWLLHDFLNESHTISQGIETPSGSFWHAIMHRREGDFSNAKYWFRRVGSHPAFVTLAEKAAKKDSEIASGQMQAEWNPFLFVDQCQSAIHGPLDASDSARSLCEALQQAEWEALFHFCYQAATRHAEPGL